mmetsp:Transcript_19745/g.43977  ORF Transcript_19745/g.43977 Transcript_19745/m.43977 type:complete len:89 (-) Transcript_19745:92-358(-)
MAGTCQSNAFERALSFIVFRAVIASLKHRVEEVNGAITNEERSCEGFTLVVGSDLIYCADVVRPLPRTVAVIMDGTANAAFVLVQSFV